MTKKSEVFNSLEQVVDESTILRLEAEVALASTMGAIHSDGGKRINRGGKFNLRRLSTYFLLSLMLAGCVSATPATATEVMPSETLVTNPLPTETANTYVLPTETATNTPTEVPATPDIDPNLIVDLGEGMWERPADMTIDLGNGPIEFEFASPEARKGMKRACDILSYVISEAGRLAGDQLYDLTGTPVTFDDWMKKAESNGGLMTGMYSLERNPDSNYTIGKVVPIDKEVNLNRCRLILHEPISDKTKSPFPGGITFASYWIKYGTDEYGGVVIDMATVTTRDLLGMPFVNPAKSDIENAKAMSQIMATFIENTERLLTTSFSNEIVLDGVSKNGAKRSIELSRHAMFAVDVVKFIKNNPDAETKWVKLAE